MKYTAQGAFRLVFVIIVVLFALTACSEHLIAVKPYEREHLASDKMLFNPMEAASEFETHVFLIREASEGGDSSFQGGCGCR